MKDFKKYDYGSIWMATLAMGKSWKDRPGVSVHNCSSSCVKRHMDMVPGTTSGGSGTKTVEVTPGDLVDGNLRKKGRFCISFKQPVFKESLRRYVGQLSEEKCEEFRQKCRQGANRRRRRR